MRRRGYVICGAAVAVGLLAAVVPDLVMTSRWRVAIMAAAVTTGFVGCAIYYVDYAAYLRDWRRIQESRGPK